MKEKYVQMKIHGPKYLPFFCLHLSAIVSATVTIATFYSI
jgi:hypothetical protein